MSTMPADVSSSVAAFRAESARIPGHPEWTIGDLHAAFDRVKDETNWKYPINKIVKVQKYEEIVMIEEAIRFIAGCRCTVTKVGGMAYQIKAEGYFLAIGA